ncbi:MAG: protein-disulfide reductase DsbD N-terminal domain-containing protein [Rikenellaceae bacterium]|nr:protein-disulfide reductase DsbD N-terminal domain-containing protein [Rikenellaceae bacterium]MCL2692741.1 protein-disulfide reductase DsbD N-terminal domain-containing protein [Rikenellaceae bacterium]
MKKYLLLALFAIVSLQVSGQTKQNLRILYVGGSSNLSSAASAERQAESAIQRTADFEQYLNQYFTHVTVVQGADYTEDMSAGYDVTIFDGLIKRTAEIKEELDSDGNQVNYYSARYLSDGFAYPAMLLADMGSRLGSGIGLKTDWYCLCMWDHALNFDLNHHIFKGPFPVTVTITEEPTPEAVYNYPYYHDGPIPDTVPMWRVQHFLRGGVQGARIGMVARPWGFLDSPDSEFISSGTCEKTLDAVAIGRHGNYFYWGFSASPGFMTDEAKQVFANAVVYTSTLKGKEVIARKFYERAATKEYVKEIIHSTSREGYEYGLTLADKVATGNEAMQRVALEKQARGEPLVGREAIMLNYRRPAPQAFEDYLRRGFRPAEKFDIYGTDPEEYHKFYLDNFPYLYGAAMFYKLIVDEDVKSLGIPNTDIRLLDKAISMLENNEDADKARRILDRYTLCTFETAKEWRNWYEANKSRIFFSQSGGWYFMVNTLDPDVQGNDYRAKAIHTASKAIMLNRTDHRNPVAAGAGLATMCSGEQLIVIKFAVHPGYHIYGYVSEEDPYTTTEIDITLPEGYRFTGNLISPPEQYYNSSGTTIWDGEFIFVRPIEGVGAGDIVIKYSYQCCDPQICFPPEERVISLRTTLVRSSR